MNMKTINTCDSINDIFGENAELTIPMECPEIVSHIRNRLPDADDTCPSAFIQAAAMLFLLNSKGKGAVEFMDIPEYMFTYNREWGYRIVHETWDMLRTVLPSAETRGISVVADVAAAFGEYYESKETMDEIYIILEDVMASVREVLDQQDVLPDMFLLLAVLSFVLDYGFEEDCEDGVYRYAYDGVFECMRHTPDTDINELMDVIRVACSIIGHIRVKVGTAYAECTLLAKCYYLFKCIANYEIQRTLSENGYDISEELEEVFGEGAVIDEDEYFCNEEEEDDDSDGFDDDEDYDKDYVSGCLPPYNPQTILPEGFVSSEPEVDPDEYFTDEE